MLSVLYTLYLSISLSLFVVAVIWVVIYDTLGRFNLFGVKMDSKFGSMITGILWPLTAIILISFLPYVNIIWVALLGLYTTSWFKNKRKYKDLT